MASQADTNFAGVYALDAEFFGTSIQIKRGAHAIGEAVTGIVDVVEHEVVDDRGLLTRISVRTYEIAVSDYTVGGVEVEPQKGDVIYETINGVACRFPVLPQAGMPAAELLDSDGVRWLVRTKQG